MVIGCLLVKQSLNIVQHSCSVVPKFRCMSSRTSKRVPTAFDCDRCFLSSQVFCIHRVGFIERVLKVSGQNSPPMFVLVVIAWPINGIWTRFSLVFVLTRCKPTAQMFDVISEAFKHLLKYCPSLVAQRPGFVMPLQDLRSSFAKRNIVLDEGELFEDGE